MQRSAKKCFGQQGSTALSLRGSYKILKHDTGDPLPLLYPLAYWACSTFFQIMGGYEVFGEENVPRSGPAILASNHASMTDPPLVSVSVHRPLGVMAKSELFKVPILGPALLHIKTFPVKRGTADRVAIRECLTRMKNNQVILIFPEGTRGDGVHLQEPEAGLALIALKSGAPIVPIYVDGSHKMLPRGATFAKRSHLRVSIGKPIDPMQYKQAGAAALGKAVMEKIAELRDSLPH